MDNGLWHNRPHGGISLHATALSLQALSYSTHPTVTPALYEHSIDRIERIQNPDGGFSFSTGEQSSIAASLYVYRALLFLAHRRGIDSRIIQSRVRDWIERCDVSSVLQTEFQENDGISAPGFQFEHFNLAPLLFLARQRHLEPIWAECSMDQLLRLVRNRGCTAHPQGRVYAWSTSQSLQALCGAVS
jgi:hypothetical protein